MRPDMSVAHPRPRELPTLSVPWPSVASVDEQMYAERTESVRDQRAERILAQTAALLAQRGDEQAIALLIDVQSVTTDSTIEVMRTERVFLPDIDGGIWGTETIYRLEAVLDVEEHLVPRFTGEICKRIAETLSYVAERNGVENVVSVRARPSLPEIDADWRTALGARLALDRPANQARRERIGGPHPVEDGLVFGSAGELRVYRALKRLQASFPQEDTISIAPLPGIRLRSGNTWSPDVLVLGRGRALIIETDGPHHRSPRRYVDDRNRDLQWQRCGVPVIRLAVEDLQDGDALDTRLREEIMRHLRRAG